ncbi:MAG: WecB/TagA/CpsF family glycosyltransferase [Candidatus Levybacteria bacterium]|nr:WecB/TagA/CpsF family glycosyltransferase [Candidatus Levybacteria bacterium]
MLEKKNILGVDITSATKKEILEYIIKNLENFQKKLFVVTPNPEFLVLANKNPKFKSILNRADLASADGIGLILAAKILGKPLRGRFTGIDLVKSLCEEVSEKPITVGFLGGRGDVAEKTAECLRKKYPGLKVGFVGEEWPNDNLDDRGLRVEGRNLKIDGRSSIHSLTPTVKNLSSTFYHLPSSIDILFVAFGAPKQEYWISENLDKIPVKVAIGVGGAFDYISGKVPRAPSFLRDIGMEWLFRLLVQPWRLKRQLSLIRFVWLVIKEKLSKN